MATQATEFDRSTKGSDLAKIFRDHIRGKRVLVTGASPNSLGEATALAIASSEPDLLILASRTQSKLDAVSKSVQAKFPQVTVCTITVDLSAQKSIRAAAKEVRTVTDRLDVLINNAGVSLSTRQWSPEGIELTLATNHIGPFLLTCLLLPLMETAAARQADHGATRIVNVASSGHHISPMPFSDFNLTGRPLPPDEQPSNRIEPWLLEKNDGFPGLVAYGASKTATILFTVALKDRCRSKGIESFCVDPGVIATALGRESMPQLVTRLEHTPEEDWKSADQGCASCIRAAFDPRLSNLDVLYLADCQKARTARYASDPKKAQRLWKLSEELTSVAGVSNL